jgi:hypothetical protein
MFATIGTLPIDDLNYRQLLAFLGQVEILEATVVARIGHHRIGDPSGLISSGG